MIARGFWALAAVVYLNTVLTFQNLWPTPWVRPVPELSAEILVLLAVLAALHGRGAGLSRGWRLGLALLLLVASVLRYIEVSAPPLFGRGLNLYWDTRHLPNLLELFWRSFPPTEILLGGLGVGAAIVALLVLNWLALGALDRAMEGRRARLAGIALPVLAACLLAASFVPGQQDLRRAFSIPVSVIAGKHAALIAEAVRLQSAGKEELDALFGPEPPAIVEAESGAHAADLGGLEGDNVIVLFLESYGSTLFDTPAYAAAIEAPFAAFEDRLAGEGWLTASRLLIAPTFGGGSWLSHGTLLGGATLRQQSLYNVFLATGRWTLVRQFNEAGYRTVAVMPGTQRQWPEGEAFGFDRIYDAKALAYAGPGFGYWRIPDQFTLHRFGEAELRAPAAPLFALVVLITSHMPFHPLPPYVEDWSRLDDGSAYDPAATAALIAEEAAWDQLGARYVESMARSFRSLGEFLETRVPDDTLVVLLGDHQPPAVVAGEKQPWTVLIHILSRNPERLEGFLARGFVPGLRPAADNYVYMSEFAADFLRVTGSDAEEAVSRSR